MHKHRGFPSRLRGTDFQFLIRRENKGGAVELKPRERFRDRKPVDVRADKSFLAALMHYFGNETFVRGNLDAGRLSWLFGREVIPASSDFDPCDYDAELMLDFDAIYRNYPDIDAFAMELFE